MYYFCPCHTAKTVVKFFYTPMGPRFPLPSGYARGLLACGRPTSSSTGARRRIYEFDLDAATNCMSIAFGRQFVSAARRRVD